MFDFIHYGPAKLQVFLLILLRLAGLFLMAPIFSHRVLPKAAKFGMMILVALILVVALDSIEIAAVHSLTELVGMALKELLVGAIIGLFFQLIFYGAQTAGSLIGYQVGLAIATEFDPNTSSQVSIIGRYWYLIATLLFIALDGHHLIIRAIADSYAVIPPAGVAIDSGVGNLIIRYSAYVFIIALKLAAPVMITLFLTDVVMGTITKTMPTFNVFFVGFPVKISVGLAVIALSLPIASYVLEKSIGFLDQELKIMFLSMGEA